MSESIEINSHKGPYAVHFTQEPFKILESFDLSETHFIIDANVADLYSKYLNRFTDAARSTLRINASESAKSLEQCPAYVEHLVKNSIRRGHQLVAIGGGITQDITAFLASTLLRGLDWNFIPTTLLAQADSCIGSKSSINTGGYKNILGTFLPPQSIEICPEVLKTLTEFDFRSGIGEMLKVHAIAGLEIFHDIEGAYDDLLENSNILLEFIRKSLLIKKELIEKDEFDQDARLVMNYGHTFGHAIEAATNFKIPHGIAVCFGMDMANFLAYKLNISSDNYYQKMQPVLMKNWRGFDLSELNPTEFMSAFMRDKKHTSNNLRFIVPHSSSNRIEIASIENSDNFQDICKEYLTLRANSHAQH